jgi:hypothetical protein
MKHPHPLPFACAAVLLFAAIAAAPCHAVADDPPATVAAPPAAEPAEPPAAVVAEPSAAVMEEPFLAEIALHLYAWFLDERDYDPDRFGNDGKLVCRVRRPEVKADEGDKSEWADIRFPQFNLGVQVKRPDYAIEETGTEVRSPHFRIVNVYRLEPADCAFPEEEGWRTVECDLQRMMETLRTSPARGTFPDPALSERLYLACCRQLEIDPDARGTGDQIIHIAPMSPVVNEVWVFLENQNLFMQFTSDTDIENPELWAAQQLRVRTIDAANNTVVSMEEMPGSNVYVTRDQVGRLLYNCIVFGKRILVVTPDDPEAPEQIRENVKDSW